MPNRVLAVVDEIIGNPTQASCTGRVIPEGGGNPVLFQALWNYGSTQNQVQSAIDLAIRAAMAAAGVPMVPSDSITLFSAFVTF